MSSSVESVEKIESTANSDLRLLSVTNPVLLNEGRLKKKYAVKVKYEDSNGKVHNKTVRFGLKGVQDYVDHHDERKLQNLKKKLRNNHHFLQSNFWRDKVLNTSKNIEEAFAGCIKELQLIKNGST